MDYLLYRFNPSLINEYYYCAKLFWLHYHRVRLFEENEEVKIGKAEHDSKEGESTNPWIKYDKIKNGVLIEYTKKKKDFTGKRYQLFMYLLRANLQCGEIRDTNTEEVYVQIKHTKKEEDEVYRILKEMESVGRKESPPNVRKSDKCGKCSFYDYCWVG